MTLEDRLARPWLAPVIVLIAVALVWGRSVSFDFVWDDYLFIVNNPGAQSLQHVPEMFYSAQAQYAPNADPAPLFRPLRTLHFALLWALSARPWIFHLANLFWHGLAAVLLHSVILTLLRRFSQTACPRTIALLSALGFAVHPLVSEVVCWAKCLDDLMAAALLLVAVRSLLRWHGDRASYMAALGWFAAAIYSKESAVPFAVVTFVLFVGFHAVPWRKAAMLASGFAGVGILFMVHRAWVLGQTAQCAPLSGTHFQTCVDMLPLVLQYARLMYGIPPFCIDYHHLHGGHPWYSASVLAGGAFLLVFLWVLCQLWRRGGFAAALGLVWMAAFFLPVSNLIPMMQYMAERFAYLPMMGLFMTLAVLAAMAPRRWVFAAAIVIGSFWSFAAVERCGLWRDELTLFVQSHVDFPENPRIEKNAVVAIFRLPQVSRLFLPRSDGRPPDMVDVDSLPADQAMALLEPARRVFEQVQPLFPNNPVIAASLGLICLRTGETNQCLDLLTLAAKLESSAHAWRNLGLAQMACGKLDAARSSFKQALQLDPADADCWLALGRLAHGTGDTHETDVCLKKLQSIAPEKAAQLEGEIKQAGGSNTKKN